MGSNPSCGNIFSTLLYIIMCVLGCLFNPLYRCNFILFYSLLESRHTIRNHVITPHTNLFIVDKISVGLIGAQLKCY